MECVCLRHSAGHFFSNLVEFVDLTNLSGATACGLVYKFFRINNIELIEKNVRLSGAENITSQDEKGPPSFTSR